MNEFEKAVFINRAKERSEELEKAVLINRFNLQQAFLFQKFGLKFYDLSFDMMVENAELASKYIKEISLAHYNWP